MDIQHQKCSRYFPFCHNVFSFSTGQGNGEKKLTFSRLSRLSSQAGLRLYRARRYLHPTSQGVLVQAELAYGMTAPRTSPWAAVVALHLNLIIRSEIEGGNLFGTAGPQRWVARDRLGRGLDGHSEQKKYLPSHYSVAE
jgi:hypothetical protein